MSPKMAKYSTKKISTWIIGGVTYRRSNAPNLSRNDGLSKEIENREKEQRKTRVRDLCPCFFFREREETEWKRKKRTTPRRGPGVPHAWPLCSRRVCPLGSPQVS